MNHFRLVQFVMTAAAVILVFSVHSAWTQQAPQPVQPSQGPTMERNLSLPLAVELAGATIERCRRDGYRVSVTVVDRAGQIKVIMREDGTGPHTIETSRKKAYTALTFRVSTVQFGENVVLNPGLLQIDDVITLGGGLPIRSQNEVIGAVGVGGAPGGNLDEACARAGIERIQGRL